VCIRFQHLFTQEVGVPFRRYRAWNRMRMAISEIVKGSNFTTAAHAAGFRTRRISLTISAGRSARRHR
jgi:methylphosphotriester-DNA--protein-cysteine methyltransferase